MNLNTVQIIGNCTRKPVTKDLGNGKTVTELSVAVNSQYLDADGNTVKEVSYFDVSTFGKQAVACAKHLDTGRPVHVEGSLRQNRWKTPQGESRSRVRISAKRVQFLGTPSSSRATVEEESEEESSDTEDIPL